MAITQMPAFGILLKRLRRAAHLSQEELAARAHYSTGYIGMLERGVRLPLPATAALLADALALSEADRALLVGAAQRLSRSTLPAQHHEHAALPFVGRAHELSILSQLTSGNGPPCYLLAGEPGIGKTRLLHEAMTKAEAAGWSILQGSCQRLAGQTPYAPLLDALESCARSRTQDQLCADLEGCGWLIRLLPELTELAHIPPVDWALPPEQERRLVFRAVRRFLANVARPAGLLLALDDLQWAGADTFDLLTSLLRAREDVPLVMLGAYRDTDLDLHHPLHTMLADLSRDGLARRIPIGELAEDEARLLITELIGDRPASPEIIERIFQRGGGVPFFLVSWALSLRDDATENKSDQEQKHEHIPWDVAQSIRQRVTALPRAAQDLLGVAAVIGHRIPRLLLVSVMASLGWSEREIMRAADMACKVRLLIAQDDLRYEFAHDLIREVMTSDLGTAYRAMLHTQIAEALEREPGTPPEQLAYHFTRSGQAAKAMRYLEQAGDKALLLHAYAEAEQHYRAVLKQQESTGQNAEAAAMREKIGGVLIAQAKYPSAIAVLEPALAYDLAVSDLEGAGRTLALLGDAYSGNGAVDEGLSHLQSYMERLVAGGLSARNQARLYLTLTELFHIGGRNSEQLAAAQQAASIVHDTEDHHLMTVAERQQGLAFLALGLTGQAAEALERAIRFAERSGDLWQLSQVLGALAMTKRIQGEHAQAAIYFERALIVARQIGQPVVIAYLTFLHGELIYLMGDWQRAREDFDCAAEIVRSIGSCWASLYPPLGLGLLALAQGNREETRRYLELEAVEAAIQEDNLYVIRWAQPNLAERDLLEGNFAVARDRLEPWLDRPGQQENDVTGMLPFLAWAYLGLGDQVRAQHIIGEAFTRSTGGRQGNALVDVLRVQALVAMSVGEYDTAEASLRQAITLGEHMPYPHTVAKTHYAYGLLCETRGDTRAAIEHFQAAHALCRQLGEGLFRPYIEHALLRLQGAS